MKLFLDDYRHPRACASYMYSRIGPLNVLYLDEWVVVKNYKEFIEAVSKNYEDITYVSFDHDLADIHYDPRTWTEGFEYHEETGLDCAKWMLEFYKEKKQALPKIFVHSMNPVGTDNIIKLFEENLRDYNENLLNKTNKT